MPWHSPQCPIHKLNKGRKIGISKTDRTKWVFECKIFKGWDGDKKIFEVHTFEAFGNSAIDEMVYYRKSKKARQYG
jgi:hypothetical protein